MKLQRPKLLGLTALVTILTLGLTALLAINAVPGVNASTSDEKKPFYLAYGLIGLASMGTYVGLAMNEFKRLP